MKGLVETMMDDLAVRIASIIAAIAAIAPTLF